MEKELLQGIGAFAATIVGLATLSVILSSKSNTVQLVSTAGNSFAGVLAAATAPVTGSGGVGSNGASAINTSTIAGIGANLFGNSGGNSGGIIGSIGNLFGGSSGSGSNSDPFSGGGTSGGNWDDGGDDAWSS